MALPDLSNSRYVAWLRFIQSIHEPPERRNPDVLVRRFLPIFHRWRDVWISRAELEKLRAEPFYYYLLARTLYYDKVFIGAVSGGARQVVGVGCGSDTRPYRFTDLLSMHGAKVLECDQDHAIEAKRRIARRWRGAERVDYLPIDLNDGAWPAFEQILNDCADARVLIMMEGVSPYIDDGGFRRFLKMLAARLPAGSEVAYDFKVRGLNEDFGRERRTGPLFRLSADRDEVATFHEEHGFRLGAFELSSELCARVLPDVVASGPLFDEDGLVRLHVGGS